MITPADIEYKEFTKAVRGYKEEEVDEFLDLIIVDMENLIRENKKLKAELEKSRHQVEQHMNSETSVYQTLEAAKALMNDIAASAERRAEILLKNAEMEADLITKDAKESITLLTEEGNRLRSKIENLRNRYKRMLEEELERVSYSSNDLLEEFEKEFLPASMTTHFTPAFEEDIKIAKKQEVKTEAKQDLTKTIVNLKF
ncbi:MAG: DivIVA domain-containing protein [Firmicutes bacterium]|nr:DivIVA domain-containing protein [Bacillota bacterium]